MKTTALLSVLTLAPRRCAALLAVAAILASAHAATPPQPTGAELLELGIYSEETKGDVDGAILIYQQVIADAQTGQSLAAQALFRLAICQDKKRDFAGATASFERLIHDYPGEKDLVALASDYLADGAALLPVPWAEHEEVQFDVKLPTGLKVGFGRYSVDAGTLDGRKTWRFGQLLMAGAKLWSQLDVEAGSMKPIHCIWRNVPMGSTETRYTPGKADLQIKGVGQRSVELSGIVYDNEEALHLIRRLPLANGYKKTVSLFVGLAGMAVPVGLEVVATEKVTVPAGTFDCYKIALNILNSTQTLWYTTDAHRFLAKFEAGGVVAEATAFVQGAADRPVSMREPTLGYSITAPAGSLISPDPTPDNAKRPTLIVIDPAGIAITTVKVEPMKNFDPATVASLRAYADHQIAMAKKFTQEFNVRPDSWQETTVAGQPALRCTADRTHGPVKNIAITTFALVDGNTVDFTAYIAPEDVETFRPVYDGIIASYVNK